MRTLGASILGNMLAGKRLRAISEGVAEISRRERVKRTGEGVKATSCRGWGMIRNGQYF